MRKWVEGRLRPWLIERCRGASLPRMKSAAVLAVLFLASPALAQSADISLIWRGGLANARELFTHAQMAPVLEQLLGARNGEDARGAAGQGQSTDEEAA